MAKTYGTIQYCEGRPRGTWVIDCEPQVRTRLKRVFARIDGFGNDLAVADTLETCRDLEWFLERYPMTGDLARLKERATLHKARTETMATILAEGYQAASIPLALPLRDYQRIIPEAVFCTGGVLNADDLGLGKQQPVDSLVLTPSGYRQLGSIRAGDHVIGSTGKPVVVTGVFPQGVQPSYRVSFGDHSSVEAGPEHLWTMAYYIGGRRLHRITVTTDQMRLGALLHTKWPNGVTTSTSLAKTKLFLPMLQAPVEFIERQTPPLPPYFMGLLIANGSLAYSGRCLTVNSLDWPFIESSLRADDVRIGAVHAYGGATCVGVPGIGAIIRDFALNVLSGAKRIPECYLRGSVRDRIALLQGLLDGDGSCSVTGNRVTYHTTNKALAHDVQDLVEHLGGVASVATYVRDEEGKPTEYPVRVRLPSAIKPFRVPRKANRYHPSKRIEPTRSLKSISYVRDVESVCIMVDAADRLYATEHAILTHNTASAIGVLNDPRARPALVVAPTHLTTQWQREIAKFAPGLRTHILKTGQPYDIAAAMQPRKGMKKRNVAQASLPGVAADPFPDVIITSYSKLRGWADTLGGEMRSVTFDEAQELRHHTSQKYRAAKHIAHAADFRLGLSATPIHNYGGEMWSVLDVLCPDSLGTREEFIREWCGGESENDRPRIRDPKAFGMYVRDQGLMIRRTRAEVGRELPPLTKVPYSIDADTAALDKIGASAAELARIILAQGESHKGAKMQAAEEFSNILRQATGLAKAPYVAEFVKLLVESGEKVLLLGWHRAVYDVWLDALKDFKPAIYTGTESPKQKDEAARRFIDGETPVLIMSLRSGAGLDGLQGCCRTIVFGELDWSNSVHDQCIGRPHRDGQTEPVVAYFLISDHGADPTIADVLALKKAQSDGIRDPNAELVERLDTGGGHVRRLAETYLATKEAA